MGAMATSTSISESPDAPNSLSRLVRSDFWFLDGNIVIVAGDAAFKVHRGQLERHSEVFNDLFSVPQPEDAERLDGCLWVELYDRPSDVFYFLSALYDGLYFNTPRADDFAAIAGVLRLSTKYLVEVLRQRCLTRLSLDWPSTLAGWDQREHEATDSLGRYTPRESCPHPILLIELALDLDIPSVLPAAFYDLARYGPSKILAGAPLPPLAIDHFVTHHTDFTLNSYPYSGFSPGTHTNFETNTVTLSRANLHRTLLGREHIQLFMSTFISRELQSRPPSPSCLFQHDTPTPSQPCHESFYFIMLNVLRSVGGIACGRDADVLFTLVQAMEMLSRTDFSDGMKMCGLRMCAGCKREFAEVAVKAREQAWEALPVWFGLSELEVGEGVYVGL
ncbi:hypothetical protein BDZ94DRAFT_1325912 [Collybia nuda]|uniref:BTB domain-containing protein n=1 Tax=Collybia nuda TaxID=64659 RepID=A0A9P6CED9_9AGAR|nr:hypothetical protein BDZ94DRAFT_1325912 [Collybia nuda]